MRFCDYSQNSSYAYFFSQQSRQTNKLSYSPTRAVYLRDVPKSVKRTTSMSERFGLLLPARAQGVLTKVRFKSESDHPAQRTC